MLRYNLIIALRNLKDKKLFTLINIFGLAIGLASCILVFLYVQDESGYDSFYPHSERTYRLYIKALLNESRMNSATVSPLIGPALKNDFPEVETFTRLRSTEVIEVRYGDKSFSESRAFRADSTFFRVFPADFIEGEPGKALAGSNSMVITRSTANRFFGSSKALGKIISIPNDGKDYMVKAVVSDPPLNSHFHYDILLSSPRVESPGADSWLNSVYYTYLVLKPGSNPDELEGKLKTFVRKYIAPQVVIAFGVPFDRLEKGGNRFDLHLQKLSSIHLHSHLDNEIEPNSDISYIYIFSTIAAAVLVLALVNFMNLSTARSEKRAREAGIRKTLGSTRSQLMIQFLTESVLMSLIAVFAAFLLVELSLPMFNDIAGKKMYLPIYESCYTIPSLFIFAALTGILAGSYPAFYLSGLPPFHVLKRTQNLRSGKPLLRSILVVFQFTVSIILITGTLIISSQLEYIKNRNLGFNKDQVVVLRKGNRIGHNMKPFLNEAGMIPGVPGISNSSSVPGSELQTNVYMTAGKAKDGQKLFANFYCDYDFLSTYQIKLLKGRQFSKDFPSDTSSVIINLAASGALGVKEPCGEMLTLFGNSKKEARNFRIIGVIDDFNHESLHMAVRPMIIHLLHENWYDNFISLRLAPDKAGESLASIKRIWKKYAPGEPFSYSFIGHDLQALYKAEERTQRIAGSVSLLSVFIACLGLFGLSAYIAERRTKEIGIRKVLGASTGEIILLLSGEFIKWVIVANLIAWPLAFVIMRNWLEGFAYRITPDAGYFIISGLSALVIACLTVSSQAMRAASANPADSLKSE